MIAQHTHPNAAGIKAKNPFTVEGDTAIIELKGDYFTTVDLSDLSLAAQYRWSRSSTGYAVTSGRAEGKKRDCSLHRLILDLADDSAVVDHHDGNRLNNRRANLRACTPQENMWNRRLNANNTSGFKGVRLYGQRFRAEISVNGLTKYLGRFNTAEEAAHAYDQAAWHYFGSYAKPNFGLNGPLSLDPPPILHNDMAERIGEVVKLTRTSLEMTQEDLALAVKTGAQFICDLENGMPICTFGKVLDVLDALSINIAIIPPNGIAADKGERRV